MADQLFDSIVACFGARFTVGLLPEARRYRVYPLGTFHYFDWQKTDRVGVSIGTSPQIVSSETARIGVQVGGVARELPFTALGEVFAHVSSTITPLTTVYTASDLALPGLTLTARFISSFYPQDFALSGPPCYALEMTVHNDSAQSVEAEVFVGLPLADAEVIADSNDVLAGWRAVSPVAFPASIDHAGIEGLTFEQVLATAAPDARAVQADDSAMLRVPLTVPPGESVTVTFYHAGYITQPTLNVRGDLRRFGYTILWPNALEVVRWWVAYQDKIRRRGALFESTISGAAVSPELQDILAASFKGLASNAWWAEHDWFSVMEIGAYHSTLDVDAQLALFFFQYWPELVLRMLNQWAAFYEPGSGYMAHDVGQHLEATGNRYGGPGSAMKVEENCNYLLLLHHYWRWTGDAGVLPDKYPLLSELVSFLLRSDTTGSGLPNRFTDNTNDWGSALITASEEQSYHGVRLVAAYEAAARIADYLDDGNLAGLCREAVGRITAALEESWLGDHYPISLADPDTAHHYSMWTTHGLLYPLREGAALPLDLDRLRIDLISSTAHTLREHGSVHSTADVRGWLTQNLWRDGVAAYLGLDPLPRLPRYLGHGEYVSYEDTTILEVANELMVVPGAVADHEYAGQRHAHPLVDGHPRPACGFGLLYALAGVQYDALEQRLTFAPVAFPLRIALTHLADWPEERIPWVSFARSIPNQDNGRLATVLTWQIERDAVLPEGLAVGLRE